MPKKKAPTTYYDWSNRPKQSPGEALPKLPDEKTKKDFRTYREFLNARAQYAGYESFSAWEKARAETGTKKKTPKRVTPKKPSKKLETGNLFIFDFQKHGKTGITIPVQNQYAVFRQMDKIMMSLDTSKWIQIFVHGNMYGDMGEIDAWPWRAIGPMPLDRFMKYDYKHFNYQMLAYLREALQVKSYTFPDEVDENWPVGFSTRMKGVDILGFREVHIVLWDKPQGNHR